MKIINKIEEMKITEAEHAAVIEATGRIVASRIAMRSSAHIERLVITTRASLLKAIREHPIMLCQIQK